ncbi:MAG: malate synthase [Saprospiraceae bacterium]|jgi:malate synthase
MAVIQPDIAVSGLNLANLLRNSHLYAVKYTASALIGHPPLPDQHYRNNMSTYIDKSGLQVDAEMADFIASEVLPGLPIDESSFWQSVAAIVGDLTPINISLLAKRDEIQAQLDEWNLANKDSFDADAYLAFLKKIGYLVEEGANFVIGTQNVDDEIAKQAGPQLVVPTSNARFALNATNARWGSLYDALYGTDVISEQDGGHKAGPYNEVRGARVIKFGRELLDKYFPLTNGSHANVLSYQIESDALLAVLENDDVTGLADATQWRGYNGAGSKPSSILLRHNGLHVAIEIDSDSVVGRTDKAGVKDITLEAAITAIQDFEDSVAAVDAQDKVAVYRNWLGLMKGDLCESFTKGDQVVSRSLVADKRYKSFAGSQLSLPGRSLLFCRNVGHLMTNPAILDSAGNEIQEGIMDAVISVLIAMHDLLGDSLVRNSRTGSVYIVKPKMHGPDEVAFASTLFDRVEDELNLPRYTIKIGVMDEERRTTVNLKECIRQVKDRVVFINTGFLDRTGDEIHTSMLLGAMAPKAEIKSRQWIAAYENWNVDIGLECGFSGRAQIGKGMWAMPDEMANMLATKAGHPESGANTAWVPSPNGATLHAIHYHQVDVFKQQRSLKDRQRAALADILSVPLCADPAALTDAEVQAELDNNVQGILGYVVRWIDHGVGCSKVPDINNVGLMEDRATLRISSQHIANWLTHGITNEKQVRDTFTRMASVVDQQNAGDPTYKPMALDTNTNLAFNAALQLVLQGKQQPNGYTEPLLHKFRLQLKAS